MFAAKLVTWGLVERSLPAAVRQEMFAPNL